MMPSAKPNFGTIISLIFDHFMTFMKSPMTPRMRNIGANAANVVKATLQALLSLRSIVDVAALRGKSVEEI